MTNTPYDYQEQIAQKIIASGDISVALFMDMGCVTGDNIVQTSIGNIQVKTLFEKWKSNPEIKIKSLVNGRFAYMPISKVTYVGEKECIKIINKERPIKSHKDNSLKCTLDHPIYTPSGWKEAGQLKIGDKILANGREIDNPDKVCICCHQVGKKMTGPQSKKYKGYCLDCYYKERNNRNDHISKRLNKSGHIILTGKPLQNHPYYYSKTTCGIPEHRYVMEQHLGRYLKPEEVVHHIDGNPQNNQIENLYLCKNQSEHASIHAHTYIKNLVQYREDIKYIETKRGTKWFVPHEVTIDKIENIGVQDVYDIAIESEDIHNFVCSDIIVHNTGKTITSLRVFELLHEQGKANKILVVCLKNKIEDWQEEIDMEFKNKDFDYEVINFESIWRPKRADFYKNYVDEKTLIIVDESHKMKSHKTKITKFMLSLYHQTKMKLILTGTPQSEEYIDYYPQMKFINAPDYDLPYKKFDQTYLIKSLEMQGGHYYFTILDYRHKDVLRKGIMDKAYYHKYSSKYDKPIEIFVDIEHSREAKKFQKDRVWRDPDTNRGNDVIADNQLGLRTYMRQSCSGFIRDFDIESPKEDWLEDFLEITPYRIVIFVNFIKEIEKIKAICKKMNRPVGVYYGAEKDLTPFKENENGIAIVNYKSGAVGINDLCIANIGIFYSPPDGDFILYAQAKARLDRIGQTKQPVFYFLNTKGSVEKPIYENLKKGQDFDDKMFEEWLSTQSKKV